MELFHVSCKKYNVDQVIDSAHFDQTLYYTNQQWIDNLLDSNRPLSYPSRKKTLYAFAKLSHCLAFIKNSCGGKEFYYKVNMESPIECPMYLTEVLDINQSNQLVIAEEYWSKSKPWVFTEFLSQKMTILEEIEKPTGIELMAGRSAGSNDFSNDKNLYEKWGV